MTPKSFGVVAWVGLVTLLYRASPASAQSAPPLGAVQSFGVLGGSAVTAAGPAGTVIAGDVGSSPTPAVTGFPPAVVAAGFTLYTAPNAVTASARAAAGIAFGNLAAQGCTVNVPADLSLLPQPLAPGVYCMGSGGLTGTITLSGSASSVWVFKTASGFTSAGASNIVMAGGATSCNVFWQIGTAATLGASSTFRGSLFAGSAISVGTGVNWTGRAIAGTESVTMAGTATIGGCSTATAPPPPCPVITLNPATLPNGTVGVAYAQTIVGSGGVAPYFFSLASGTLPTGLTLTAAGVLAGTPTTAGSFTFTVRGTDFNGCPGLRSYTVVIAPAPAAAAGLSCRLRSPASTSPNGTVGVAYLQLITASGGTAPYVFGVTAGALPSGLTLTPAGLLAGTPTVAGTLTFTIRATDANGCFASLPYTIVIVAAPPPPPVCPPISLAPTTLPDGAVGTFYSQTLIASGGTSPYFFGVAAGSLVPGLLMTSGGVISGTPNEVGSSAFIIRVTDANGCFAERPFSITIGPIPVPTLPQVFILLLGSGLAAAGYFRLRRRARAG